MKNLTEFTAIQKAKSLTQGDGIQDLLIAKKTGKDEFGKAGSRAASFKTLAQLRQKYQILQAQFWGI